MLNSNSLFGRYNLNILVTNDDGIYSDGLWAVVEELKHIGQVTVVAPDRDQSGAGTSVTLRLPVRLHKIKPVVGGVNAFRWRALLPIASSWLCALPSRMK